MLAKKIATVAVAVSLAVAAIAPATGAAKATGSGTHTVIGHQAYLYTHAGKGWTGVLQTGETFKVKRLSRSGKWTYGMAYGHVKRHAWIKADSLIAYHASKASPRRATQDIPGRVAVSCRHPLLTGTLR